METETEGLVDMLEEYEKYLFPIELPSPIEAIKFRMEQMGLSERDLIPFIGSQARVSEVLSGERPLSLRMMKALRKGLGIPVAVLLPVDAPQHIADIISEPEE